MRFNFSLGIFLIFLLVPLVSYSAEEKASSTTMVAPVQKEKEYDGLWFCGFNFQKALFTGERGKLVRQAFNYAIPRAGICQKLIGDTMVPSGVIPPKMPGYDSATKGYSYDLKKAKMLMQQAGYTPSDKILKQIVLLHTDGEKTVQIAKHMEKDLKQLGIKLIRRQISYADTGEWEKELSKHRFHLYLMGYKAEDTENPLSLIKPLFSGEGDANIGGYQNDKIDFLVFQIEKTVDKIEKTKKLEELNRLLIADPPTINFFYIMKLPDLPKELLEDS